MILTQSSSSIERRIELAVGHYRFLGHEGIGLTEVRVLPEGRTYFYDSERAFRTGIESLIRSRQHDIFVGIAPRSIASGTRANIKALTCLVLDLDPIGSTGDVGESATCLARALQYNQGSIVVSSGSGAHSYFSIEPLDASLDTESAYKAWGLYHKGRLSDTHVKVDNTFDLPRVFRLWGTVNSKTGRTCTPVHLLSGSRYNFRVQDYLPQAPRVVLPSQTEGAAISNGSRNQTLTSLAGAMRRKGMAEGSIKEALLAENRVRCSPPLSDVEVLRIVSSVSRYAPSEPLGTAHKGLVGVNGAIDLSLVKGLGEGYFKSVLDRKSGILSGFKRLDDTLSGWKRGQLVIIGARPNEGKTTLMVQLMESFCKQGLKGLYFPTELGAEPVYDKILSRLLDIPLKKFQSGSFTPTEKARIESAKAELQKLDLKVVEDFGLTAEKFERYVEEVKPDVIGLDYIQALSYNEGSPQEIGKAIRLVREVGARHNCITIVGSQLNRGGLDSPMSLGRIKGSGAIEELGDIVLYLTNIDRTDYPVRIDLSIVKSRYSSTDNIPMKLWSTVAKFEEA